MKRLLTLFVFLSIFLTASLCFAQGEATPKTAATNGTAATINITAATPPEELARVAFMAQGGEKFRKVQNMVLRGSVDLFAPNSTQSIPGGFVIVTSGDKVRIEIDARPAVSFKQIYDGQNTYSSLPGVELPPPSKFGLGILVKFDQPGYKITAIPDRKKLRGFRISDMDGNATEFFIDSATGRVMTFLIGYNGYTFGTEHKKFKEFDGILVPTSFTQRLEMPQGAFFADYNVKDVKLNQTLSEDVFLIPN
jgi:hypothetical protein